MPGPNCIALLAGPGIGGARVRAQAPKPSALDAPIAPSAVRDRAGLFDRQTIESAMATLSRVERSFRVPVIAEALDSLDGRAVRDVTAEHAKAAGNAGLYVLISKRDRKIDVLTAPSIRGLVPDSDARRIQAAFVDGLRTDDANAGLRDGITAIEAVLAHAEKATPASLIDAGESGAPLVSRNQVRLNLAGAEVVLKGALAKAAAMGQKSNIAVVDEGGHLLAFARMDGARPASAATAITKATTAATFRAPTGPLPAGTTNPDPLLNLSLQNAALASGGKITTLYGGIPILVEDQVIGAVGVGGGTAEQDVEVARAGVAALTEALNACPSRPTTAP